MESHSKKPANYDRYSDNSIFLFSLDLDHSICYGKSRFKLFTCLRGETQYKPGENLQ